MADLSVPYVTSIPRGLTPGSKIEITAIPHGTTRFNVKLLVDSDRTSDCGFHFGVRFNHLGEENQTVRNAKIGGKWGKDRETQQTSFPFTPNVSFDMQIIAEANSFRVTINSRHFCYFKYRLPLDRIGFVLVDGDVSLSNVKVQ